MIKFRCSSCATKIGVDDKLAGKRVKCPKCGVANIIPAAESNAAAAPKAAAPNAASVAENDILSSALNFEQIAATEPPPQLPGSARSVRSAPTMMRQAPQTMRKRPPRNTGSFALYWWGWLALLAAIVLPVVMHQQYLPDAEASLVNRIHECYREVLCIVFATVIVSGIVFYVARRSKLAASIACCVVVLLGLGASARWEAFLRQYYARQEFYRKLNTIEVETSDDPNMTGAESFERMLATSEQAAPNMIGADKEAAEATADICRWLLPGEHDYWPAAQKLQADLNGGIGSLASPQQIQAALDNDKNFIDASKRYEAILQQLPQYARDRFDKTTLTDKDKKLFMNLFAPDTARDFMSANRATERQIAEKFGGMLKVLLTQWGKWRPNGNGVAFQDSTAAAEYNLWEHEYHQAMDGQSRLHYQMVDAEVKRITSQAPNGDASQTAKNEMIQWMQSVQQEDAAPGDRFEKAGGINPTTLNSPQDIQQRLVLVQRMKDADAKMELELKDYEQHFRTILAHTTLSEDGKQRMIRDVFPPDRYENVKQWKAAQHEGYPLIRDFLTLLLTKWGKWHVQGGGLHFDDPQDNVRCAILIGQLGSVNLKVVQYRSRLQLPAATPPAQ